VTVAADDGLQLGIGIPVQYFNEASFCALADLAGTVKEKDGEEKEVPAIDRKRDTQEVVARAVRVAPDGCRRSSMRPTRGWTYPDIRLISGTTRNMVIDFCQRIWYIYLCEGCTNDDTLLAASLVQCSHGVTKPGPVAEVHA